ncbi:MAG: copper resistance CopC family protein [Candidatus Nanopelagicales bacterium]
MKRGTLRASTMVGVITVMLAGAVALGVAPAGAHSQLLSTSPADGAVLAEPPSSVVLTFNEALIPDVDSISINDAMGNVVASRSVEPVGATLSVPWPDGLPAGAYQVAYRVVSGDGHPVIGAIMFTITGAGGPASGVASQPESSAGPVATAEPVVASDAAEGSAVMPVVIAALVVILLGGAAVFVRRRGGWRG